ncbi:MAG: hypothetical protein R3C61_10155 [Bacteroidia bacterium]
MKTNTYLFSAVIISLFAFVSSAYAQGTISFNGSYIRPMGNFQVENYRQGGGFGMDMMTDNLRKNTFGSFQMGFRFDVGFHGSEQRPVENYLNFEQPVELQISNESLGMAGVARFITTDRLPIRLYADGIAGSRYFSSTQYVMEDGDRMSQDCDEEGEILTKSWTFMYGAAAGMQVRINEELSVDLRTTYTRGSNANFVDLSTVAVNEQNGLGYATRRAATDMVQVSVGLNMVLGPCTPSRSSMSRGDGCASSCSSYSSGCNR